MRAVGVDAVGRDPHRRDVLHRLGLRGKRRRSPAGSTAEAAAEQLQDARLHLAGRRRRRGALPLERVYVFPGRHARARGHRALERERLRRFRGAPAVTSRGASTASSARSSRCAHAVSFLPDRDGLQRSHRRSARAARSVQPRALGDTGTHWCSPGSTTTSSSSLAADALPVVAVDPNPVLDGLLREPTRAQDPLTPAQPRAPARRLRRSAARDGRRANGARLRVGADRAEQSPRLHHRHLARPRGGRTNSCRGSRRRRPSRDCYRSRR